MTDAYVSTNKLPDNTYPERSHLLLEGIVDMAPGDFILSVGSGLYEAYKDIELTRLIKLGDRLKGYPPRCLEAKAWVVESEGIAGDVSDFMHPLPYNGFFIPGSVNTYLQISNTYTGSSTWTSFLTIFCNLDYNPSSTLSYSYKVYNTIYEFTNLIT